MYVASKITIAPETKDKLDVTFIFLGLFSIKCLKTFYGAKYVTKLSCNECRWGEKDVQEAILL